MIYSTDQFEFDSKERMLTTTRSTLNVDIPPIELRIKSVYTDKSMTFIRIHYVSQVRLEDSHWLYAIQAKQRKFSNARRIKVYNI